MIKDNFKSDFDKKRSRIRKFIIATFVITISIILLQFGAIYYGYTKVEENGGFRELAVKILKEINSIQKEAEVK